jgi:hypothetical protein
MNEFSRVCFVVMPIGAGEAYTRYLNRYVHIIEPAIASVQRDGKRVYKAVRADFISTSGSITRAVLQHLYAADVVIADLTDLNPNVFYELGVRHALRRGTILVGMKGTVVPFDVGDLRVIFYEDRVGGEIEAIPKIKAVLEDALTSNSTDDSPVFVAVPDLAAPSARQTAESAARLSALEHEVMELRIKLSVAEATNLNLRESTASFEKAIGSVFDRLGVDAGERLPATYRQQKHERPTERAVAGIPGLKVNPWAVFVLMPFRPQFDGTYQIIRDVASRWGFRVLRADEIAGPGRITDQILTAIQTSGLILADITETNPNVLYEVGMAHTLGKETVLLSQSIHDIPFDVAAVRVTIYDNTVTGAANLAKNLNLIFAELRERRMHDGEPDPD